MKWCDYYAAKNSKFITYSLISLKMHSFYSLAEMARCWQSVSTLVPFKYGDVNIQNMLMKITMFEIIIFKHN